MKSPKNTPEFSTQDYKNKDSESTPPIFAKSTIITTNNIKAILAYKNINGEDQRYIPQVTNGKHQQELFLGIKEQIDTNAEDKSDLERKDNIQSSLGVEGITDIKQDIEGTAKDITIKRFSVDTIKEGLKRGEIYGPYEAIQLIEEGKIGIVIENIRKFKGLNKEVALRFLEEGNGWYVAKNLSMFRGVDHQELALKLLEKGEEETIAKNLSKFKGLNKFIAMKLIENKKSIAVAESLNSFKELDKDVLYELTKKGRLRAVLQNLSKFEEVDHQELALKLLEKGEEETIAKNLSKFKGLNKIIAMKLIEKGKGWAVLENLNSFIRLDRREVEIQLINENDNREREQRELKNNLLQKIRMHISCSDFIRKKGLHEYVNLEDKQLSLKKIWSILTYDWKNKELYKTSNLDELAEEIWTKEEILEAKERRSEYLIKDIRKKTTPEVFINMNLKDATYFVSGELSIYGIWNIIMGTKMYNFDGITQKNIKELAKKIWTDEEISRVKQVEPPHYEKNENKTIDKRELIENIRRDLNCHSILDINTKDFSYAGLSIFTIIKYILDVHAPSGSMTTYMPIASKNILRSLVQCIWTMKEIENAKPER